MYLLHSLACVLHGKQCLLVDVGGFDRIYLLFQCSDLCLGLLEAVFVGLLTLQCGLGGWLGRRSRQCVLPPRGIGPSKACSPFLLFWPTYFRARASCSSIWFRKCFSRFCSMSSCERNPRMAFLGAFFFAWAEPPPNQPKPQPDILFSIFCVRREGKDILAEGFERGRRRASAYRVARATDDQGCS